MNRPLSQKLKLSKLSNQRGVVTLVVSLGILLLSTIVIFNVSNAILMEQKITNNDARAKMAFQAAEAGMTSAVNYLTTGTPTDANADGIIDPVIDTDNDGIGDTNTMAVGSASVTIVGTALTPDLLNIQLVAQGFSDDKSATRTITQTIVTINPLPNVPQNPMITKGGVVITGSATVHNPEGHSTIWSGGDIDLGSNNSTSTEVPDITDAGYPACMDVPMTCVLAQASTRTLPGVDLIEYDSSMGALSPTEFFENFFGKSPSSYRASMVSIDTVAATANTDADLASHEVVWIEGDMAFSGITTGCTVAVNGNNECASANTEPSVIIVNGNATFSGGNQFYGILFVMGNINLSGNTTVHGSLISAGNATSGAGGSLDVYYRSDTLEGTAFAGATSGTAGTWKDF